nr:hypothetical protein [Tanacetum cinerariifolium]
MIEWLQDQLGDLKGKSSDTQCALNTLDLQCLVTANHDVCMFNYVNDMNSHVDNQSANVSIRENQKKHKENAKKSKELGSRGSLASFRPRKPRTYLRWIRTGRIFAMYGKLTASSSTENKFEKPVCDNASTSNSSEPSSKGFLNSDSLLGSQNRRDLPRNTPLDRVELLEDDPIAYLNKEMAFLTTVASLRGDKGKVILVLGIRVMLLVLGETILSEQGMQHGTRKKAMLAEASKARQILDEEQLAFLTDPRVLDGQAVQTINPNTAAFLTKDLDTYDSDCDNISNAKAVLIANISNFGSDVILEVSHSETYLNDIENQSVHAMLDFEQSPVVDFLDNEIHRHNKIQ